MTVMRMVTIFMMNVKSRYLAINGIVMLVGGRIFDTSSRNTTSANKIEMHIVIFSNPASIHSLSLINPTNSANPNSTPNNSNLSNYFRGSPTFVPLRRRRYHFPQRSYLRCFLTSEIHIVIFSNPALTLLTPLTLLTLLTLLLITLNNSAN